MALSRTKTWISGEVLTASDLNTEFNSILTNALSLISPLTGNLDAGAFTISNIGGLTVGTGDSVQLYSGDAASGQLINTYDGTTASPDTTQNPPIKMNRVAQYADGIYGPTSTGETRVCTLLVENKATVNSFGSSIGIVGHAQASHVDPTAPAYTAQSDAIGASMVGHITGSGTGIGMGAYLEGGTYSADGLCIGAEVRARNNRGSADTVTTVSASKTRGLWVTPGGANGANSLCGVGVAFGYSDLASGDVQWDVGIGFGAWSGVSSIKTTSILDETDSVNSIVIKGAHSGGAIVLSGTPGGATSYAAVSVFEVIGSGVTSAYTAFGTKSNTSAAAFTLTSHTGFSASGPDIGAGSAITNAYGFAVQPSLTTATNNYGFYGNIAAGANRWNIHMVGTAQNYLAGVTGIGIAASDTAALALAASTTGVASLRIPHGSAPTSPVDGDVWTTTAGLYVRINGATVGPLS